jgi:hypothetical protein
LRRKKIDFEIAEICGGCVQIPNFLLLKHVYEGRANPNPLTQGGRPDGQTTKILYIVGTPDLWALWSPPVSLNLVHVLVFSRNFYLFIFYFYVFSVFINILYNKNKVFSFHFYIFVYLDASLKFGERRHTSFFFK